MKITLGHIFEIYLTLNELSIKSKNFKINYWITRNIKILSDSYSFFINNRQQIYDDYLEKDENDNYFSINNGNTIFHLKESTKESAEKFSNTINELINTDCEIEPYLINISDLMNSDLEITAEQIMAIDCLFKE